jgi:hypothetical protein
VDILPNRSNLKNKKAWPLIFPVIWLFSTTFFVLILSVYILLLEQKSSESAYKYAIFSAKPKVLGYASQSVTTGDARAKRIDEIFRKYKCPIQGYGESFVREADKNNIPYWLVAAVAFQESSCGKNTPVVKGEETYNLYGWGVWGPHVFKFDSMEEGISTVSKYMSDKFISKGVTEPCEIMKVYTPPSNGSWCKGIKFFRDEIVEYETP